MPSTDRATTWSVTINNPNEGDEEAINLARQKGWKVEGQLEKGKEGTPHYQLMVKTPQTRFSTIKKHFPRAHIEVAHNVAALEQYVHKESTREGELPTASDMYPSLSKLWDLIYQYCVDNGIDIKRLRHRGECHLDTFDYAIRFLITQGYYVETLGSNPQNRSCWKNYGTELMKRSADRQTDRQDETFTQVENITIPHADSHHEEVTDEESLPPCPPSISSQSSDV